MQGVYYVILHYQNIKDTKECINSILMNRGCNESKVVVIDNNSPNGTGTELQSLYKDNNQVKILLNRKNEGFAKGNNVGYRYAKEKGAKFIVQINNDTLIEDRNFESNFINLYNSFHFGVLGPDVFSTLDHHHQNPMPIVEMKIDNVKKQIRKNKIGLLLNSLNLDILIKKTKDQKKFYRPWQEENWVGASSRYVLQGACLIFSPIYIDKFDGLYDGTFMYYEEHILAYMCEKNNVKMLYSPRIQIKHKEGLATNTLIKKNREKRKFKYKNSIVSLENFLKEVLLESKK